MSFQGLQWFGFNIDDITVKKVFLVKLIFRFILIKVKIYSCYGVNTPSLKCHLNKSPIHKFFLFCVQFKIPLQQLQSNGCAADPYSFNRSFTAPHSRYFLKNLGDFTGFYRTSLIVTPPPPDRAQDEGGGFLSHLGGKRKAILSHLGGWRWF